MYSVSATIQFYCNDFFFRKKKLAALTDMIFKRIFVERFIILYADWIKSRKWYNLHVFLKILRSASEREVIPRARYRTAAATLYND